MTPQRHVNIEHEFYDILQPGQIRLLKAVSIEQLSFKFEVVSLKGCPKYGALSYVCGDDTLCKRILIQGNDFWVTKNLFLALDQFRKNVKAKKPNPLKKPLWIDAACINQGISQQAFTERGEQVQRMTWIYKNAETVYVWLGQTRDEWRNSLAAAKLANIEELHLRSQNTMTRKYSHKNWDRNSELEHIVRDIGIAEAEKWSRPETRTKDAWLGIIELWKSEWWTRAWTLQEGTVPGLSFVFTRRYERLWNPPKQVDTKVHFMAGNEHMTWNALYIALQTTTYIMVSTVPGTDVLKGTAAAFSKVAAIRQLRVINLKAADPFNPIEAINRHYLLHKKSLLADPTVLDPLDTLNRFRMAECRDPRDKVFAAIGLLPALRSSLKVDYHRSTLDIYVDLIMKLLSASDASLDFLGFTCKTHNGTEIVTRKRPDITWGQFPSWLPNWYLPLDLTPLPKVLHVQAPVKRRIYHDSYKMAKVPTSSPIPAYNVCGRHSVPNAIIGDYLLHSSGWHLDTVSDIMWFAWSTSERTAVLTRWKTRLSRTTYPEGETFDRDLRRVHCADVKYEITEGLTPVSRGYEIVNALLLANRGELNEKELAEQTNMKSTLTTISMNRSLCMTTKGRLGLVPYSSLAGDKIVALYGGQVLYVLRQKDTLEERYEYIGESYVHGLMDGEVSGMADREEITDQVFTLE